MQQELKTTIIHGIDADLLNWQRHELYLLIEGGSTLADAKEALEGILNLLDAIQDDIDGLTKL